MIKSPKPLHPGQVLDEVYMKEMNLNQSQLAAKCHCSPRKINEIVNGKRAISPEFAIVLEKIPASLAKKITSALSVPTIGIGAGKFCDGQILVTPDMLALNVDFHPRFVRHYSNLADEINKAVKNYISDVKKGNFPSKNESY